MGKPTIWDRVRSWRPHNLVIPEVQSISSFYHQANPGIHPVDQIAPPPKIPPIAPDGPPLHGSEPTIPTIMFDRGSHTELIAPGKCFFREMMNNTVRHV